MCDQHGVFLFLTTTSFHSAKTHLLFFWRACKWQISTTDTSPSFVSISSPGQLERHTCVCLVHSSLLFSRCLLNGERERQRKMYYSKEETRQPYSARKRMMWWSRSPSVVGFESNLFLLRWPTASWTSTSHDECSSTHNNQDQCNKSIRSPDPHRICVIGS